MPGNSSFIKSEPVQAWIGQFAPEDQEEAVDLLRAMHLVSHNQFHQRLAQLIVRVLEEGGGPIGLFAEREVKFWRGRPNRLFKETAGAVKRAYGAGPAPVAPLRNDSPQVGSEGIVAQLISDLCAQWPKVLFSHPGPSVIRKKAIRRLIVVTDFIGSGKRVCDYINSAWRVRSVRSWWSARATKGATIEVLAYSATSQGRLIVEQHPSAPTVHIAIACPTMQTSFRGTKLEAVKLICKKYSPVQGEDPLGFRSTGALLAFAHGIPNNAPIVFHKKNASWAPLFPARKSTRFGESFNDGTDDLEGVREKLRKMRQTRLAASNWPTRLQSRSRHLFMILAAVSSPPRNPEGISAKTAMTIIEIDDALSQALSHGWIDGRNRLTDDGHEQLHHFRKEEKLDPPLPIDPPEFYHPDALRTPTGTSS